MYYCIVSTDIEVELNTVHSLSVPGVQICHNPLLSIVLCRFGFLSSIDLGRNVVVANACYTAFVSFSHSVVLRWSTLLALFGFAICLALCYGEYWCSLVWEHSL